LKFKIYDDAFNGIAEIGINASLKKIDYSLDSHIKLPDYLDKGVVFSRK
jgi:hypothetical protein